MDDMKKKPRTVLYVIVVFCFFLAFFGGIFFLIKRPQATIPEWLLGSLLVAIVFTGVYFLMRWAVNRQTNAR